MVVALPMDSRSRNNSLFGGCDYGTLSKGEVGGRSQARRSSSPGAVRRREDHQLLENGDAGKDESCRRRTIGEVVEESAHWRPQDGECTSTAVGTVINLVVDLTPAGLLPLASSMKYTGIVPAVFLTFGFAAFCVWMMFLVAKTVEITGKASFYEQWVRVIGSNTAFLPMVAVQLVTFGCCLGYLCLYAEMFPAVLSLIGCPGLMASRSICLLAAACVLVPLSMLKDFSAFAFTSGPAFVAIMYTIVFVCIRALDGSYDVGGRFHYEPIAKPRLTASALHLEAKSLALVNALAVGYMCHYNGCKYYRELQDHTPKRFGIVVAFGIGSSAVVFATIMIFGYLTFGDRVHAVLLAGYSPDDKLSVAAQFGLSLALLASFPLMFCGLREASIDLLTFLKPASEAVFTSVRFQDTLTAILVLSIVACARVSQDPHLVIGVVGAVCGSLTIYVVPCLLYVRSVLSVLTGKNVVELYFVWLTLLLGVCIGALGLYVAVVLCNS